MKILRSVQHRKEDFREYPGEQGTVDKIASWELVTAIGKRLLEDGYIEITSENIIKDGKFQYRRHVASMEVLEDFERSSIKGNEIKPLGCLGFNGVEKIHQDSPVFENAEPCKENFNSESDVERYVIVEER